MNERIGKLRATWVLIQANRWYRAAQFGIVALAVVLMLRILTLGLSELQATNVQFDPAPLGVSLLLTWFAFYLGTFAWAEIVRATSPSVPYLQSIEFHLQSVAAKYLPGVGWSQVSKAVQLYRGGIPTGQISLVLVLELVLMLLTGLFVAFQSLSLASQSVLALSVAQEIGLAFVLLAICVLLPWLTVRLVGREPETRINELSFVVHLYLAELLDIIGWLAFGSGFWFTIWALGPLRVDLLPYSISTLALSVVVGIVVVFVPNGYGVRELTMSALLQAILPVPATIVIALVSRIVLVAAELLGLLPIMLILQRRASGKHQTRASKP